MKHGRLLAWSLVAICASIISTAVRADDDELDSLVMRAASLRQSVDSYLRGQRVRAVPLLSFRARCPRVGLIYLDSRGKGGPRVATYDVCGNDVTDTGEVSPALPGDSQTRDVGLGVMQAAIRYGRRTQEWRGFVFEAVRISPADTYGCAQVESTVTSEGLLVANSAGRVCP